MANIHKNVQVSMTRLTYKRLWNSINAKRGYSWDSNPWVWVIEFGVQKAG